MGGLAQVAVLPAVPPQQTGAAGQYPGGCGRQHRGRGLAEGGAAAQGAKELPARVTSTPAVLKHIVHSREI